MRSLPQRRAATLATIAMSMTLALPASAAAQFTPRTPPAQRQRPDFLFGHPHVVASLQVGYAMPTEGPGKIINTQLPADQALDFYRPNFNSASVSGELAVRATERLYITGSLAYAGGKTRSEFLNYLDNNNLPIQQTTTLDRKDLTFGVKEYLWAPGRSIGQLAWIPRQWTPFVGAAGGWMWYTLTQSGDFIDFQTNAVYSDRYRSTARTGTFNLFAGADWTLTPAFSLTIEGRYDWARAPMQGDFQDFRDINLSGFRASGGISLRF